MIRYLVASLLLFGLPVSPSWGEDCVKLVANKYCLGGSFSKARDTFKNKERFSSKPVPKLCNDCSVISFIESNALGLDRPLIMVVGGIKDRVISLSVCPNPELVSINKDKYSAQVDYLVKKTLENYGKPIFSHPERPTHFWDLKGFLLSISTDGSGVCLNYSEPNFVRMLGNSEGF